MSRPASALGRRYLGVRLGVWLRLVVLAILVAGLMILLRGLRLQDVAAALRRAVLWPVILAAALNFLLIWCKAVGWHVMLKPSVDVPTRRLFRYNIAALTASALTPLRTGEVLRLWFLRRREAVPYPLLVSVAVGEKIMDALAMLILVAPISWLLPTLPVWLLRVSLALLVVAATVVAACRLAMRWKSAPPWLARFLVGMAVLRSGRLFALTLGALLAGWFTDLVEVWLVMRAVHLDVGVPAALLVLFTMNVAISVPSTPAHVGALELGAVIGLDLFGVPSAQALAFAVLYHAMQLIPLLIAGLADARFALSARAAEALEP